MTTANTTRLMTAEELFVDVALRDVSCELVRGEVKRMTPAGGEHGMFTNNLGVRLTVHVRDRRLGVVFAAETGFILSRSPDTVRAPDVAFVSTVRLPNPIPKAYIPLAPDLAVEVLSPSDSIDEVEDKVDDYLAAGSRLVWVLNPKRRAVLVYRPGHKPQILSGDDLLDGEDVVPGFSCQVAELFA